MGCTQSKIENEETVTRCKDRKQFMKEAVTARNAFAAAHSGYTMSLKNTGAALSDYAHGEVQHHHQPIVTPPATGIIPAPPQPHYDTLPPPPPPLPNFPASPLQLQRAASTPVQKLDPKREDTIIEEENEEENEIENDSHSLKHRTSRRGNRSGVSAREVEEEVAPPPSPPRTPPLADRSQGYNWDYFFPPIGNVPGSSLADADEGRVEREEIERKVNQERAKRAEVDTEKVDVAEESEKVAELPPQSPPPAATKAVKKVKEVVPAEGKRGWKENMNFNLLQIFSKLDDCFLKASESAHEVSKMLEANRLHYHSNFADNRGHIDHSARVMRVITWNRSFKGLANADDGKDDFDSEENETHATVLDKMLAWEKKLYDEVKAGELMKLEYQKKLASLNRLKKRGASTESIEKAKAAVSHLHTRYIVDMQSMDSTVLEINRLRDGQLYPKLVELVDGMATMWETMQGYHENQSNIVTALRSLDISQSPKETSEHHHDRTEQLYGVVQGWHLQFEKLMTKQKEYIKFLNNWLKLNLIPIDNNLKEKVSSPQRLESPPIQALLHAWHDFLEKLPDEHARTTIAKFAAVINTIFQCQVEEMKLRDTCEDTRKELDRKTQQFEDWYNKYMQRRTPPDEMDPDRVLDKDFIAERKLVVDTVKQRLEQAEESYQRQCVQVREKSLMSLKTVLPELFRALLEFSRACSDMYRNLRSITNAPRSKPKPKSYESS